MGAEAGNFGQLRQEFLIAQLLPSGPKGAGPVSLRGGVQQIPGGAHAVLTDRNARTIHEPPVRGSGAATERAEALSRIDVDHLCPLVRGGVDNVRCYLTPSRVTFRTSPGSQRSRPAGKRQGPDATPAGPLLRGPFRWLFIAGIGDGIGDDVARALLPVVAVAVLGAGAFEAGVLNALGMVAFLVLGVPAGVLVDRWPRKPVLIGANLVRAAVVLTVPLAFAAGALQLWHLFLVAAVISAADVFFTSAQSAVMPTLLAGDQLARGYARVQTVQSALAVAAPGVTGVLIRIAAAPALLAISGLAYLFSAAVTCGLPEVRSARSPGPTGFWAEARHGLVFTLGHPIVRALMGSIALVNAAGMWGAGAKVVFVLNALRIPVDQVVALGAVSAAGGLAASLMATGITRRLGIGRTKVIASLAGACSMLLVPAAPALALPAVFWVGISGFGWSYFVVLNGLAGAGIVARLVPADLMGRAMSSYRLVTLGVMPVASLAGGFLALLAGEATVLWASAVIAACSALPVLFSPLRHWETFPEELDVGRATRTIQPVES